MLRIKHFPAIITLFVLGSVRLDSSRQDDSYAITKFRLDQRTSKKGNCPVGVVTNSFECNGIKLNDEIFVKVGSN